MKKVVLKLFIHDDRDKKKAMKAVSSIEGIDSIAMDMKASTMTVIGEVDPVQVTYKLRKSWGAEIVTVGPAKEEKKKEGDDKEKDKKGDDEMAKLVQLYQKYYGHPQPLYYYPPYSHESHVDDNPTSCTIS